jgi:Cu(I)/Ag(I) efflux system membrane protein CusA/SilA
MVDVGVVFTENIIRHLDMPSNKGARGKKLLKVIYESTTEVASAVITALLTTVISFLPVFAMQAAEGKLFKPLAFTKTFAMISALIIGLIIIPALASVIFSIRLDKKRINRLFNFSLIIIGIILIMFYQSWLAITLIAFGINGLLASRWPDSKKRFVNYINIAISLIVVLYFLSAEWMPLGAQNSLLVNLIFVSTIVVTVLGILISIVHYYEPILRWCLNNKWKFLSIPIGIIFLGIVIWQGFDKVFGFLPSTTKHSKIWISANEIFPGIGEEFMPTLDEGSFLLMPTTMPHSGIEENLEVIAMLDKKVNAIPEVKNVVGKWGRVNSALDPAPTSMYENVINYKSEYILDENGHRMRFKVNKQDAFVLSDGSLYNPENDGFNSIDIEVLVPDKNGKYFRQWRDHIHSPDDIWNEIISASEIPGLTSAPKLQPIQTRLVMLQTGMRAPMGIKVFGPDLESIEQTGYELEQHLRNVPGIEPVSVFADRVVGKPYLEIDINRKAISRYGLTIQDLQMHISTAIGGMKLSTTVEGRERFPVRARYAREFRDNPEDIGKVLIPAATGVQVPLGELAEITYLRGPQLIKSENTFLVGYVIFDKKTDYAEVDVVENAQDYLNEKLESGEFVLPAGVNYIFTGNYENQIRATKRLLIVVPVSLMIIFLILYFQFRSVITSAMIFTGIFVAFSGGFLMLWLYGQNWFMNFDVADINMRNLFQMGAINLSVAVWVGFIALFGIATDDGVIMGTYLMQVFKKNKPKTVTEIRASVVDAGNKRVRPAMMTAATTIIALIPVLTSTGKGSDIMVPMAIPSFGGMIIQVMTMFVVPVLYSLWRESKIRRIETKKL